MGPLDHMWGGWAGFFREDLGLVEVTPHAHMPELPKGPRAQRKGCAKEWQKLANRKLQDL